MNLYIKKLFISFLFSTILLHIHAQSYYIKALLDIETMLFENLSIDFKKAVFATEKAFYGGELYEDNFNNTIKLYSLMCEELARTGDIQYNGKDKDIAMAQCAAFIFMTDTTQLLIDNQLIRHIPFSYNHEDFAGQKDWSNMFVSTLMQTKTGNCHSLPYLYKMIMDELGYDCHLALAPNHMYIKANTEGVGWYNIELTCGDFPADAWYVASGYIHLDAIRNGIYMQALSDKEAVCMTLVDLAQGYQAKFGVRDGAFILQCCDTALEYFSNYINALLLKGEILTELYKQSPEESRMEEINTLYTTIHQLGYRKMPNEMYMKWLGSLSNEKQRINSIIIRN